METEFEETEFDDQTFFSASLLFSLSVVINGNKTDVTFNTCGKGTYYAVNLVRNGYCVNSYTMISSFDPVSKSAGWRFEEDHVPRELKVREHEFSKAINNKGKFLA